MSTSEESFFACDMNAIPADQREAHMNAGLQLFASVQGVTILPNGFRFRLPTNSVVIHNVATFISNERLCCPFFAFSLDVEADHGAIYLTLAGRSGVRDFIKAELSEFLTVDVIAMMNS
jgi:hypothetical protein